MLFPFSDTNTQTEKLHTKRGRTTFITHRRCQMPDTRQYYRNITGNLKRIGPTSNTERKTWGRVQEENHRSSQNAETCKLSQITFDEE